MFPKSFGKGNLGGLHQYKPLLILLLFVGYYYKFCKFSRQSKIVVTIYCLFLAFTVIYSALNCCDKQMISTLWSLIEYTFSIIFVLPCKGNMKMFFIKLCKIDQCLRINQKHNYCTKLKLYAFILTVWTVRIAYTTTLCLMNKETCYRKISLYLVKQLSLFALDLNRVWRVMLLDMIRYRLKVLRMRLKETPDSIFYLYVHDDKTLKTDKIKFCLQMYRNIADIVDLIHPELFASVSLSYYFIIFIYR